MTWWLLGQPAESVVLQLASTNIFESCESNGEEEDAAGCKRALHLSPILSISKTDTLVQSLEV